MRDKAFEKIKQNPKNVRFETINNILIRHGFTVRQPKSGSSHYTYKKGKFTLTIPRHQPVRAVYIRKAIQFIEASEEEGDK